MQRRANGGSSSLFLERNTMLHTQNYEIGDIVNDTAGYPGNVTEIIDDYHVEVEWEDGSVTREHTMNLEKV